MRKLRCFSSVLLLVLVGFPSVAVAQGPATAPPAKKLTVIPFYSPEKMWQLFSPFIAYLKRETGEPWELKLYPNHDTTIAGVCAGEVDVALLGPGPLGLAYRECGAFPILVPLGRDGKPKYHAMMITGDPAVATVADLRGKKVGFLKGSTVAHGLALKILRDAGLGRGAFEPVFYEGQDRIVTALLSRAISGAVVKEVLYHRFKTEPLRLLQTSDPLPNFAFAALPAQLPALRERFLAALLKLRPLQSAADAATVQGWDDEIRNGFVAPAPDFLPAVLKMCDDLSMVKHESR